MKTDKKGCSTCEAGSENYELYYSKIVKKNLYQYEFRHSNGELFTTVKSTLKQCQSAKDEWLKSK